MPQWVVFYPPIDYRQINTILRSAAATIGRNPSGCLDTHRHHREKPEDSSSPSLTVGQHCSTVAAMDVLGSNPSPATRKGHVMNRKTYGAHCSGWQHSMDERRRRHENTKTITCLTLAATGFLILSLQPYAGPWSILAGFMCCSPVMLSFALSKGTQK